MEKGFSKSKAKQKADEKFKNDDWNEFMRRYTMLIEYIMKIKDGKIHANIMKKVRTYISDGFKENRAIQMADEKYRYQLEGFIAEKNKTRDNEDTDSGENDSENESDDESQT